MRVPPRAGRARLPRARRRLSGAALLLLGCLPALVAVLALALLARGGAARSVEVHPAPSRQVNRPPIVPRSAWLERTARDRTPPHYDGQVVAILVHHTASSNDYDCADAPRVIRRLYAAERGHTHADDIGFNFLVDRCGTIYEGRAGGVDRAVTGAHTPGLDHGTAGVAALGTFTEGVPVPRAMTDAIAALAAWKLGLAGIDPRARVRLFRDDRPTDRPGHRAGPRITLPAVAGHGEADPAVCPGAALSARLPDIRALAAHLQGRDRPTETP